MKNYSQNQEQEIILNYFQNQPIGYFLDLGANDGQTLSNTRALALKGWGGVLVEPANTPFKQLHELYDERPDIYCVNAAVANKDGVADFYESGEHLGIGDHGLLSTLKAEEIDRWVGSANYFMQTKVECITFKTLLEKSPHKKFDLISIDCEGVDFDILKQMDLATLGCQLLIVETNSVEDEKYIDHCRRFGMKVLSKNMENLIFCK